MIFLWDGEGIYEEGDCWILCWFDFLLWKYYWDVWYFVRKGLMVWGYGICVLWYVCDCYDGKDD